MSQILTFFPRHDFENLAIRYLNNRYVKTFTAWKQFAVLLYAQISGKDSLREIEHGMAAQSSKLYHLGVDTRICRSTLCEANANRDYRLFEKLFYILLDKCRTVTPQHKFRFKNPLYTIDATVIDLCLSVFPWAKFRTAKGALKLHYQFDHAGNIPSFLTVTHGKRHEITVAKDCFTIIPDSIYCFDKGYADFTWFRRIHEAKATFVTRAKDNLQYGITGQHELPKNKGIFQDAYIKLTGFGTDEKYPSELRLIRYYDKEHDRILEFLTNNFKLSAQTITQIYKARWQIELFFKWIKQNLKIKTFLGTTKNAVLTQIWVAMCYYLILAFIKYQTKYKYSLSYLHNVIKETVFERVPLIFLLNLNNLRLPNIRDQAQLCLQF
jgi:hypothetical protein